jgi:hypothetical protein
VGSTCNACNFSCANAAINVNALPKYKSDTASLFPVAYDLCPSSCGGPQPACCHNGKCQRGYPECPFPGEQVVDSGADSGDGSDDACPPMPCLTSCPAGTHDVSTTVDGCLVWQCCVSISADGSAPDAQDASAE